MLLHVMYRVVLHAEYTFSVIHFSINYIILTVMAANLRGEGSGLLVLFILLGTRAEGEGCGYWLLRER